jgi:hypothetical protein
MQKGMVSPCFKSSPQFTVKDIFLDNHNWDVYRFQHKNELRQVEIDEVEKMLSCKDSSRGFFVYYCPCCDDSCIVYFGCNSRLCSCCGKNYTDKWSKSLKKALFDVTHRHIVMSVPEDLWPVIKSHRELLKVLMDAAIAAINDTLSYFLRRDIRAGVVVVLHPFSRDLSFKPHLHVLVTEGGFDKKGHFISKTFIPAEAMRKTWQYQVLIRFKKSLLKTPGFAGFIDGLFKRYPNGFYVYLPKESRITSKRKIGRYVARYVRHPAIANTRICGYDGKTVTFWYKDNDGLTHVVSMDVFEFIEALIQHVPDRQFKMIRYYGAYARKWKSRFRFYLQESITQVKLSDFPKKCGVKCPICGYLMDFVMYWKKGPPSNRVFGSKIHDWNYISTSAGSI